jgi:PAS domain S-box-containing protein
MLDIRTVLISSVIGNFICLVVVASLWERNRKQFRGLSHWLVNFLLQFISIILIALRGRIPDFISITFGTPLALFGTLYLYIGLQRFLERTTSQLHNFILLLLITLAHIYFAFIFPDLAARNILFSAGLLIICSQCAWLVFFKAEFSHKNTARMVGAMFVVYSLVSIVRIILDLALPVGNDFFKSGQYDVQVILGYQVLTISLTFSLTLLVNRRLIFDLEKDILARKDAEAKNARLAAIVESSDDAIISKTLQGTILSWNQGAVKTYGYTAAEMVGASISVLNPPGYPDDIHTLLDKVGSGQLVSHYETLRQRKDGQVIDMSLSVSPILDAAGNIIAASTIGRDITDRKQAEAALRLSEENFTRAFLSNPAAMAITRLSDGKFLRLNEAYYRIMGFHPDEILERTTSELNIYVYPQERDRLADLLRQQGSLNDFELSVYHKSGQVRKLLLSMEKIPYDKDDCILSTFIDITDRKKAEEQLAENERRYRSLFENMLNGFAYCEMIFKDGQPDDFIYLEVNDAFARLTGLKNVNGRKVSEVIPGIRTSDAALLEFYGRVALTGKAGVIETYVSSLKMWFSISVYSPQQGYFVAVFDVITERKQAQEALEAAHGRLRNFVDANIIGVVIANTAGEVIEANDYYLNLIGHSRQELEQKKVDWRAITPPEWLYTDEKALAELADHGRCIPYEKEYVRPDGTRVPVMLADAMLPGSDDEIAAFVLDLSEQKRILNALKQNESRLDYSLQSAEMGAWELDLRSGGAWRTLKHDQIFGYETLLPEWTYDMFIEHVLPDDRPHVQEKFGKALETGMDWNFECRILRQDGAVRWIWAKGNPEFDDQNKPFRMFGVVQDITVRKQVEEDLRESEERFRTLMDGMLEGGQIIGFDWRFIYINDTAEKQNRRPNGELLGKKYQDIWPGIEATRVFKVIRKCMEERVSQNLENHFQFPDGESGWFNLSIQPVPEGVFILSMDITEHKKAEEDLIQSEIRYRELVQNANSAILRWKSDGTIIFFNEFAQAFFGYGPDEILGRDVNILVPEIESTGADLSSLVRNIAAHPLDYKNIVNENICRDGSRVWMNWSNQPVFDADGQVTEILAVGNDITARRQAEQALQKSEQNYRLITENASDMVYWISPEKKLNYISPSCERLTGYAPTEFLGDSDLLVKVAVPEDQPLIRRHLARAGENKAPDELEYRIRTKAGQVRWISHSCQGVYTAAGHYAGRTGTNRDITTRKEAEQEIQLLNDRLHILISAVQELASARDMPSIMAGVRSYARKLTGAEGSTFVLREADQCFYAEEDAVAPLWKNRRFPLDASIGGWVILNKQPAVVEDIRRDPRIPRDVFKGTSIKSLAMVPIRTSDPLGAVGIYWAKKYAPAEMELQLVQTLADAAARAVENVHLFQELEQRVQERTGQLQGAVKELEAFSYSISHDLRAPLRAMNGFSKILLDEYQPQIPAEASRYLDLISRNAGQMGALIDDLLRFSRLNRQQVESQTVAVEALVRQSLADLQADQDGRQLNVIVHKMSACQADPALLKQVWVNLLANAIKFTRKEASPTIEIGSIPVKEYIRQNPGSLPVDVDLEKLDPGSHIYYVKDNGVGFDMQYVNKLFGVFQRLHRSEDFEGTGVGLAIVQRIVHRHNGRVWAYSEPSRGAAFYFTIGGNYDGKSS